MNSNKNRKRKQVRKSRHRKNRSLTSKLSFSNSIHIDDEQINNVINNFKNINQRDDFFSFIVKLALFSFFLLFGIIVIITIVINFNTYWHNFLQKFSVIIIFIYGIIFIILSFDILHEKDRNYLISMSSMLVALIAFFINLFGNNNIV